MEVVDAIGEGQGLHEKGRSLIAEESVESHPRNGWLKPGYASTTSVIVIITPMPSDLSSDLPAGVGGSVNIDVSVAASDRSEYFSELSRRDSLSSRPCNV